MTFRLHKDSEDLQHATDTDRSFLENMVSTAYYTVIAIAGKLRCVRNRLPVAAVKHVLRRMRAVAPRQGRRAAESRVVR